MEEEEELVVSEPLAQLLKEVVDVLVPTLLRVVPDDMLCFDGFPRQAELLVRNVSATPVAFRIKVTAAPLFVVRPARGVLAADEEAVVVLSLAPGVLPAAAHGADAPRSRFRFRFRFRFRSLFPTPLRVRGSRCVAVKLLRPNKVNQSEIL